MSEDQRLVADLVVERLRAWGVQRVSGHSGDGINAVLEAMRRAGDAPHQLHPDLRPRRGACRGSPGPLE
ncbi:MAG TPA: hypothetical protein VIG96_09345 [Blastococcus sp.]